MKAVTGTEMNKIDRYSIEQVGIPGIVLMENAALKIVKHVQEYFYAEQNTALKRRVVIAAGKGNNGGDAFAAARHLFGLGYRLNIYCLFEKEQISGDARVNFDILQKLGMKVFFLDADSGLDKFTEDISNSSLVIDGIFGTGFKGQVQGLAEKVINIINENSGYTLSIDIASGIESSSGAAASPCIHAHKTVTFEYPKIGQLIYPGAQYTGKLAIEGIGIPFQAAQSIDISTNLTDREYVKRVMPLRKAEFNTGPSRPKAPTSVGGWCQSAARSSMDSTNIQRKPNLPLNEGSFNKGNCGKVLIVAGSSGMAGSGCIASKASLRTGSGLVYSAVPQMLVNIYQSVVPEAVCIGLSDTGGVLNDNCVRDILDMAEKCDVAAIGPGLSGKDSIYEIIRLIADNIDIPVVLDADALNAAARNTDIFARFKKDVVITPHPGEMSRLTGLDTGYIQRNRMEVAVRYAKQWGITVVLKGAGTIIANKDGTVFINPTGNAGMATAGSGDALTGIIASLIGQGAEVFQSAAAGVYLHGLAGDIAAGAKGEHGVNAMDIVENIPYAVTRTIYH